MRPTRISLCLIAFGCFYGSSARAQPAGDSIFVTTRTATELKFPYKLDAVYTDPVSTAFTIAATGKTLELKAISENSQPAHLFVTAGQDVVEFVLCYKSYLPDGQRYISYSDKDVFDALVSGQQNRKSVQKLKENFEKEKTAKVENSNVIKKETATVTEPKPAPDSVKPLPSTEKTNPVVHSNNDKTAAVEKNNHTDSPALNKQAEVKKATPENDTLAESEKNKDYYVLTGVGRALVELKKYTEAKTKFHEALALKPGDLYAATQIEKIDKLLQAEAVQVQTKAQQEQYKNFIAEGEKAIISGQLNDAKKAFEQALSLQPKDATATAKLKLIADWQKREAMALEIERQYSDAKNIADSVFSAGNYEQAKLEYNKVLKIISRPWPKEQLKKINKVLGDRAAAELEKENEVSRRADEEKKAKADSEKENNYTIAISLADILYKEGSYSNAKREYLKAKAIFARPWPQEQLANIDKKLKEEAGIERSEKAKLLKAQKDSAQFDGLVKRADAAFEKNDYAGAKQLYSSALQIRGSEDYPQQRLKTIQAALDILEAEQNAQKDSLQKETAVKKKYDQAIAKGKANLIKNNLDAAKASYEEALSLIPSRQEAQVQLERVNAKLRENDLNTRYESKVQEANRMLRAKEYDSALVYYKDAYELKPSETYLAEQIGHCQFQIRAIAQQKAYNDSVARVREMNRKLAAAIETGDRANKEKRFADAAAAFNEALSVDPANGNAQRGLKIATDQMEMERQRAAQLQSPGSLPDSNSIKKQR